MIDFFYDWCMPTLKQFRYLVAVADQKHFGRAAEVSHVTQPTLSAQIKELELRLGAQLIEQSRPSVVLTPTGREIVRRARSVLAEVDDIRTIARHQSGNIGGTLRLGVVQSLGSYLMPLIVPDIHDREPDLRLYIREGLAAHLIDQLIEGTLDFLFFPLPVRGQNLRVVPLFEEPLLVVAPRTHRLAMQPEIAGADLKGETLLTLEAGHRLYEQVRDVSARFGAHLSHDYEGTSLDTLRQMVAMEIGISLMPALYVRSEVARETLVRARPFAKTAPSRTVGMVWRQGASREDTFQRLATHVRDILGRTVPEVRIL